MTPKEFESLRINDRVRLGGKKGTVQRVYQTHTRAVFVEFDNGEAEYVEAEYLDVLDKPPAPKQVGPEEALKGINGYRAKKGRQPLDPIRAGWEADDLIAEYERLIEEGSISRS